MSIDLLENMNSKSVNERIPLNHRIILYNRPVGDSVGDIELNVWEWPGKSPTILFCHGTSFHGRCFDQIIATLPHQRIITFDLRGHGYSSKVPPYTVRVYGEDLNKLIEKLDIEQAIGVGHSVGGYAITLASILNPNAFSSLILLEPAFFPKPMLMKTLSNEAELALNKILQNRNSWSSIDEMYEHCQNNIILRKWSSSILKDYCTYGLIPKQGDDNSTDGYIQACSNETQYSTYVSSMLQQSDIYEQLNEIGIPVHIVRSGYPTKLMKFYTSLTPPNLVTYFQNADDTKLEGVSHFVPMEVPLFVSELIKDTLRKTDNWEENIDS